MLVKVGESLYEMEPPQVAGLLMTAAQLVPDGIYAVAKDDYCELRNDRMAGIDLRHAIAEWEANGWTVHANIR